MNGGIKNTHISLLTEHMVQESHTQDIVSANSVEITPEQEEILWWEYYEKIIYLEESNGKS
jgi:hypothetical protein